MKALLGFLMTTDGIISLVVITMLSLFYYVWDARRQQCVYTGSELNGKWNYLARTKPESTFETYNPCRFLKHNDRATFYKCIVLDEEEGRYTMGMFNMEGKEV